MSTPKMTSDQALVPTLFRHKIRSILIKAERRARLPASAVLPALAFLRTLPISDQDADEATIIALARRHQLTGYDAAYLALAQANAVPIATRDSDLRAAAQVEHVVCLL